MMRARVVLALAASIVACGEAKSPDSKASETGPLGSTRLELTLDDATKPPPLDGRAFAVRSESGELSIYVYDEKADSPTCTDVAVGGWMDKVGGGSAAQIRVARFSGGSGKYAVSSIAHVRGGSGKSKVALRSATAKGVTIEISKYDNVFEASLSGARTSSGTVSGIVCASH